MITSAAYRFLLLTVYPLLLFSQSQKLVITEVMFDVPGGDYHDEFVELFNADTIPVDITAIKIGDQDEQDQIVPGNDSISIVLNPKEYILILDGSYPGNSSTYDSVLASGIKYAFINDGSFGKSGFSNTMEESVILLDEAGFIVDQYRYSLGNPPGFSDEKISVYGPNISENWGNSLKFGGSPGAENSISSANAFIFIKDFAATQKDSNIATAFSVLNLNDFASTGKIILFVDQNFDMIRDENDVTLLDTVVTIRAFESLEMNGIFPFDGLATIDIRLEFKNEKVNCKKRISLYWSSATAIPVKLNEINFSPLPDEPEWIELLNTSDQFLNIGECLLFFDDDILKIPKLNAVIQPESYLLVSEDTLFPTIFNIPESQICVPDHWSNLKVGDQKITLVTPGGQGIDSLHYEDIWWEGNHDNRSLEKKNPDYENSIGMWGLCRDDLKATPGKKNSWNRQPAQESSAKLKLNTRFFSPNHSSENNYLEILIDESLSGTLDLLVFDLRGRIVCKIAEGKTILGKSYFLWDGQNDKQMDMPVGTYLIWARFKGQKINWQAKDLVALYW